MIIIIQVILDDYFSKFGVMIINYFSNFQVILNHHSARSWLKPDPRIALCTFCVPRRLPSSCCAFETLKRSWYATHSHHVFNIYESIKISTGWWFGTWILWLSIYWESSSRLTNIFQRGWNHQPVTISKNRRYGKTMAVAMAPGAPDHSGIHCEISPGWWLNHVKSHVFSADSPFKSFKL